MAMYLKRCYQPAQPTRTPLWLAATGGDVVRTAALLRADDAVAANAYATNAQDEAVLADVLDARQSSTAHLLIDVYERDLRTVGELVGRLGHPDAASQFWLTAKILVASGEGLCERVEQLVPDTLRVESLANDDERLRRPGQLVLLKRTRAAEPKVLLLSPSTGADRQMDERALASVVEAIYLDADAGGLLDVLQNSSNFGAPSAVSGQRLDSLLALAARNGMVEVFFRLYELLAGPAMAGYTACSYLPLLCHLAHSESDRDYDEEDGESAPPFMDALRALVARFGRFRLDDDEFYANATLVRQLEPVIGLHRIEFVELMLENIARVQRVDAGEILASLLHRANCTLCVQRSPRERKQGGETAVRLAPYLGLCLKWPTSLWAGKQCTSSRGRATPALVLLCSESGDIEAQQLGQALAACSGEHADTSSDQTVRDRTAIFHGLVRNARCDVLRAWFAANEALAGELYDSGYAVFNALVDCIGAAPERLRMAALLVDVYASRLSDRAVLRLVLKSAECAEANGLLRTLVALPQCADVAADWRPAGDARSPMFTALMHRCAENFDVLWESVRDKAAIKDMTEYNGDSILAAAIWSPHPATDLFLFSGYYVEEDDDGNLLNPNHNRPARPAAELDAEQTRFAAILQQLLAVGCDPMSTNGDGDTLLHLAVLTDNLPAARLLLDLGVDAMQTNAAGRLPLHGVHSVPMLELLIAQHSAAGERPADLLARRSERGETPLAAVVVGSLLSGPAATPAIADPFALLDALLAASGRASIADDCVVDTHDGTTLLHCCTAPEHVPLVRWLLAHGADVNARNASGETPLHAQLPYSGRNAEIVETLLAAPALKWKPLVATTALAGRLLAWLCALSEERFERLRPLLWPRHETGVERLFAEHFNGRDANGTPVLHEAIRSDTNAYCLQALLRYRDQGLKRAGCVCAAVGDAGAWAVAMNLCRTAQNVAGTKAQEFRSDVLRETFGNAAFARDMRTDVLAMRDLLDAGVPVPLDGRPMPLRVGDWARDFVSVGERKTVVAVLAVLLARGAVAPVTVGRVTGTVLEAAVDVSAEEYDEVPRSNYHNESAAEMGADF